MNFFLIGILIITFFIFILKLLQRDESFDLRTDQTIDTIKGDTSISSKNLTIGDENPWVIHTPNYASPGNMFYVAPKNSGGVDWGKQLTMDRNGNVTINGNLTVNGNFTTTGNITSTGEISAKKVTSRDGEIAIGSGDNGWQIRAQGVGGKDERWLEFWNNQEGNTRSHGRVLFNKFGNMWNQHQDVWSNTVKSTADSANSKVDSILNGSAKINGNVNLTGDVWAGGNLYAAGGHLRLGSGDNKWWLRTGHRHRELEFWNQTANDAHHVHNGHGTTLIRHDGSMWNAVMPRTWSHDKFRTGFFRWGQDGIWTTDKIITFDSPLPGGLNYGISLTPYHDNADSGTKFTTRVVWINNSQAYVRGISEGWGNGPNYGFNWNNQYNVGMFYVAFAY